MLTIDEALTRVLALVDGTGVERVAVADALGRVLAEDVVADVDLPPWDNSSMDGYAVRAADTASGDARLDLLEVIAAGSAPTCVVVAGTASAIMTGAPMPAGADAVVMVEDTDGGLEAVVQVRAAASVGQHVRRQGESVQRGSVAVRAGGELRAGALALLAALGRDSVVVARRPVVGVLSTGDEVVAAGRPLAPGQIYSSNGVALVALAREAGAIGLDLGNVADDPALIEQALASAVARCDVVVTTGGVSVGAFDHVKGVFERIAGGIDFWKVSMKPGKPLAVSCAIRDGRRVPLLGLPGNPVSCMVNFLEFVRPMLRLAMGAGAPFLPEVQARVAAPIVESGARVKLVRVVLALADDGAVVCRPAVGAAGGPQSSGSVVEMAHAHGLALLGSEARRVAVGEVVRVQVFDPSYAARPARPTLPS